MTRTIVSTIAAALVALVAATPATAAPERSFSLDKDRLTATWTGNPTTAFTGWTLGCDAPPAAGVEAFTDCEETLVEVTGEGTLDVALPDAGDGVTNEWDLEVYASDAQGARGDLLGESFAIGEAESVSFDAADGHYLVVAIPFQAVQSTYGASVTFTPFEATE